MNRYHDYKIPHIIHISLRVSSLSISKRFYQNLLGLQVIDETEETVVLGTKTKSLLTLVKADKKNLFTEGLYHVAFLLESMEELAKWFLYQQKQNLMIDGASNHLVSQAFYLSDPDGNGIEVYADVADSYWNYVNNAIKMDTLPLNIEKLVEGIKTPKTLEMDVTIGHLHLKTKDAQKMGEFYKLLGLDITLNMGHAVFMSFHQYHHHLGFNQWNKNKMIEHQTDDVDIEEFTIQYPSKQEMYSVIKELNSNQVAVLNSQEQMIIYDPMNMKVVLTYYSLPQ